MFRVEKSWLLGLVWCGLWITGLSARSQDLPASWKLKVANASAAELADGLLIAQYKYISAEHSSSGKIDSVIDIDDQPVKISQENAAALSENFKAQVNYYEEVIQDRGYRELPEAFYLDTNGDCSPFGVLSGPVLISQSGCHLTLWQNGMAHEGVIVQAKVAFQHNKSAEVRFGGEVEEDAISAKFRVVGFAKSSTPVTCSLKLSPVKQLSSDFGAAFLERAVALLDLDDYEHASMDLDRAIELNPDLAEAWNLRSQLRSVSPDSRFLNGKLAVEDAKRACELTSWNHWQCLAPLACAYAEAGDFDAAIDTMTKAVPIAPCDRQTLMNEAVEKFRQKKPMRYPLHSRMPAEPIAEPNWIDLPERPGVSIHVFAESKGPTGTFFGVKTSGLPSGARFQLWTKGLMHDWRELPDTGIIKEDGSLALEREGKVVPMNFGLAGFQRGESFTVALVAEDQNDKVTLKFIPRPIAVFEATSGYGLEAELLDVQGELYLVTLRGFGKEKSIKGYSAQLSADKESCLGDLDLTGMKDQPISVVIATAVYGKSGDIVRLRFVGEKGEIRISLPWGDRLTGKR